MNFFLFFIGSAVTGNVSCDAIQGIEEAVVPGSFLSFLLSGVKYALFGSLCAFFSLYFFSPSPSNTKTRQKNAVFCKEEEPNVELKKEKNLTFVENVQFLNLAPVQECEKTPVVLKVETCLGPGIIPFPKLEVETDEGKPVDNEMTKTPGEECLEPEIILAEELGECPPQDKINERKPMVFVGGVSASTTPIELVSEFRKQGFNVTVLPRIRYGVSFGFCPDLVLSSIEEVEELLACERVWVKDRWVDIRPYIPKDGPATVAKEEKVEEEDKVEYISMEDFATMTATHTPPRCTPPLGSPIHFGQPYIYPLGSPIYVPQQQFYQTPEIPFLNGHTLQTYSSQ